MPFPLLFNHPLPLAHQQSGNWLFSVGSCLQQVSLAGYQVLGTGQYRLRACIRPVRGRQGKFKGSGFCLQPGNVVDTSGKTKVISKPAFLPVRT